MIKDAKEAKAMFANLPVLSAESLIKDKVYFSQDGQLIQVQQIWPEKQELYLFSISEQYHQLIKFKYHKLVKLVR